MTRVLVSNVLTTTSSGADLEVCRYEVPLGKKFNLRVLVLGGEPTTFSTTESSLGYVYLSVYEPLAGWANYRGIEVRNMQGDVTGVNIQYLVIPIPGGIDFTQGEIVAIRCSPTTTTSSRWKGTIIGDVTDV